MLCPVCNLATIVVENNGIELDYCTNCQGVWFDSGELELLLESEGLEGHKAFLDSVINSTVSGSPEKKRKCPICTRKMKQAYVDPEARTLVDICRFGHGIWFDGGELDHLLTLLAAEPPGRPPHTGHKVVGYLRDTLKLRSPQK